MTLDASENVVCDKCNRTIPNGDKMLHCHYCGLDFCTECVAGLKLDAPCPGGYSESTSSSGQPGACDNTVSELAVKGLVTLSELANPQEWLASE
jgi:hypothetical protein